MRSIVKSPSAHKPHLRPGGFVASLLVLVPLGMLLAGCGDGQDQGKQAEAASARTVYADSALVVDLRGWTDFRTLSQAIAAGEQPTAAAFDDLAHSRIFLDWSACADAEGADPARVGRWLENAFAADLQREVPRKINAERRRMGNSYRYSRDHVAKIDELLIPWTEPAFRADFLDQMGTWIAPDLRPRPLTLHFLPALPEVRNCGAYFVDTGVLAAGGNRQLRRQLVAMLYRSLMVLPEIDAPDNPRAPVAAVLREILNQGVAVWIEQAPNTFFAPDHPELHDVVLVPEKFFDNGLRMTTHLNRALPGLLGDDDLTVEEAKDFARQTSGGGDLAQAGYAWSATIVHHLGEQRLREVCQSPAGFLVAYQEAALRNPVPRPRPGTPGSVLAETQPPLDIDAYEKLLEVLREFETP